MPTFRCAAILFDLDGVLVDSTRSVERQWRAWAHEKGVDGDKLMALGHGVRAVEMIRAVAPHLDAEAEAKILERREASDEDVTVMAGALDLLQKVPAGRWGVVTSGIRRLASGRLQRVGIPVPKVLVPADEVVNGKPHPEPYLKGAELMSVKPEECLVIEDAPAGIRSAQGAGMNVIALASTYPAAALGEADVVIQKLDQIHVAPDGEGKLIVSVA
jgi:sugar-phosphatase